MYLRPNAAGIVDNHSQVAVFGSDGYALEVHIFREFLVLFHLKYCTLLRIDTEVILARNVVQCRQEGYKVLVVDHYHQIVSVEFVPEREGTPLGHPFNHIFHVDVEQSRTDWRPLVDSVPQVEALASRTREVKGIMHTLEEIHLRRRENVLLLQDPVEPQAVNCVIGRFVVYKDATLPLPLERGAEFLREQEDVDARAHACDEPGLVAVEASGEIVLEFWKKSSLQPLEDGTEHYNRPELVLLRDVRPNLVQRYKARLEDPRKTVDRIRVPEVGQQLAALRVSEPSVRKPVSGEALPVGTVPLQLCDLLTTERRKRGEVNFADIPRCCLARNDLELAQAAE